MLTHYMTVIRIVSTLWNVLAVNESTKNIQPTTYSTTTIRVVNFVLFTALQLVGFHPGRIRNFKKSFVLTATSVFGNQILIQYSVVSKNTIWGLHLPSYILRFSTLRLILTRNEVSASPKIRLIQLRR